MNTPAKPSKSRGLEQPKTLEEILQDVLEGFQVYAENQYTDPRAAKYGKNFVEAKQQALTEIQALIEREVIGSDQTDCLRKRRNPEGDSDTDTLWDLANGIGPISISEFSTWGSSERAQFRKFGLELRNTIWEEAQIHENELRATQRQNLSKLIRGEEL